MTPPGGPAAADRPGTGPAAPRRHLVDLACPVDRGRVDALRVRAGRGDHTAFAAFYDETVAAVFGTLCHVLGNSARVERATEDVYRQLWQTAPDFDPAVRTAYSAVLSLTRRALVGLVHERVTGAPTMLSRPGAMTSLDSPG